MSKQIIQLFGLDPKTRNEIGLLLRDELDAFYCVDRILPTASTESPYARWLRTIGSVAFRNNVKIYVPSGYFPTKEARNQFADGQSRLFDEDAKIDVDIDVFTVWVDTIKVEDSVIPEPPMNAPSDFKWEEPDESEYDLRITIEDGDARSMFGKILEVWKNR